MIFFNPNHGRAFLPATLRFSLSASKEKRAAQIISTGPWCVEECMISPHIHTISKPWQCVDKGLCVGMPWCFKQLLCAGQFADYPEIHDRDTGADMLYDRKIMGDKHVSKPSFFLCVHEEIKDLRLNRHIQR